MPHRLDGEVRRGSDGLGLGGARVHTTSGISGHRHHQPEPTPTPPWWPYPGVSRPPRQPHRSDTNGSRYSRNGPHRKLYPVRRGRSGHGGTPSECRSPRQQPGNRSCLATHREFRTHTPARHWSAPGTVSSQGMCSACRWLFFADLLPRVPAIQGRRVHRGFLHMLENGPYLPRCPNPTR